MDETKTVAFGCCGESRGRIQPQIIINIASRVTILRNVDRYYMDP